MKIFLLQTIITLLIGVIAPNIVIAKNWTDVVTSQPEGYVVDLDGNVKISSAEGLAWLVSVVNGLNGQNPDSFETKIVKLVSDIDLSDNYWDIPIGSENSLFKGTFNGAGFEIYNLSVVVNEETSDYHALFGYVENANIKNVGIVGCSIESYNSSACLAYSIYNTEIENCYSSGDIYCYGDGSVAGLVIISKNSTMLNCYTWIENLQTYYGEFVGGLAGYFEQSTMKNCYSASHWIESYSDKSYVGTLGGYVLP